LYSKRIEKYEKRRTVRREEREEKRSRGIDSD
jgi:hypothetical protein